MQDKIREFNALTERFLNGIAYLENPKRTDEEIENWLPELGKIHRRLSDIFLELRQNGIKVEPEKLVQI